MQNYAADKKLKTTHAYFTQNFLTCEDCFHEAADMTETLDCHEVRELHPAAHDVSDLNNSFRSSLHLLRINLPTFDESFDK